MAEEERDYKGTKFELTLIGSGWLKETSGKRKYQKFIIKDDIELRQGDIVQAYLAKQRRNENSPNYYLFLDLKARDRKKKRDDLADPPPQDREDSDDRDNDPDSF